MTDDQIDALNALKAAQQRATDTGLFDLMLAHTSNPDSINDVCDATNAMAEDE